MLYLIKLINKHNNIYKKGRHKDKSSEVPNAAKVANKE